MNYINYLLYYTVLCSAFFLSLSLDATLVITKIINSTSNYFILRIYNATGTCTHESIVPAYADQNVTITLLKEQQPHAYIIKAPLPTQTNQQEHDFININADLHNQQMYDFVNHDRSISYIAQPVGKTARTLYTCIPQNPYNLEWWYLCIELKQFHYAFYGPGKEQDIFHYLPFTLATNSKNTERIIKTTRAILCFYDDQAITVKLDH